MASLAIWSGATLFANVGVVVLSRIRVKTLLENRKADLKSASLFMKSCLIATQLESHEFKHCSLDYCNKVSTKTGIHILFHTDFCS